MIDAQRNYLTWLRKAEPRLYLIIKAQHPELLKQSGLSGLSGWADIVSSVIDKAVPIVAQKQAYKQQIKVAQAGKPITYTPPANVPINMPANVQQYAEHVATTASADGTEQLRKYGTIAAAGLGLFLAFKILKRKKIF